MPATPRRSPGLLEHGALVGGVAGSAFGAAHLASAGVDPLLAALAASGAAGAVALLVATRARRREDEVRRTEARSLAGEREQAVARAELLRSALEATPVALLAYRDAGQIRLANAEARRLFFEGESPEGQNFLRIVSGAPEDLRRALLGTSDDLFSVELSGQRETYHLSRRTVTFEGEVHTVLLVQQLTYEISRREVEVLRKVIRIMSHELNNSLAPIGSMVHSARLIAKNPAHLDKLARVFDTIEERAAHLGTFLSGYAALARLPKPKAVAVPLEPLLERIRALYPAARVGDGGGATGHLDAAQIEQLLINLLKNATEAGGDAGAVLLEVRPEESGAVTFEVSDRGKGLTPEALESAFLPLYTTKEKGSGMGLPLCREIAEAHGGRISIKNRAGGGSTVLCWLPGPKRSESGTARATLTLTRA